MARNYDPPNPIAEALSYDAWNTIEGVPRGTRLIYNHTMSYTASDAPNRTVWRPLRIWATDAGIVAVITEIGADGPSVTNAARDIHADLTDYAPQARVIEHYPSGAAGETYDEIIVGADGRADWRPIPIAELRALLGDTLDTTRPTAPAEPDL